jgi:hypothetical protein
MTCTLDRDKVCLGVGTSLFGASVTNSPRLNGL